MPDRIVDFDYLKSIDFQFRQDDHRYVLDKDNLHSTFVYPLPSDQGYFSCTRLYFFDHVLHLIITHTICPHGSNYSMVTQKDLQFLFNIKLNYQINVIKFITDDMLHTIQWGIKNLLYGMLVSEIIDFFFVDTQCDPPKSHALFNPSDEHTVKKIGFELKNGNWVKKGVVDLLVFDDEGVEAIKIMRGEPSTYLAGCPLLNLVHRLCLPHLKLTMPSLDCSYS
ncbi:Uncharacterized protein TCM_033004 [Theobroma cacao]|uniref:Uncharacterized protein n=1 Tax=Theobroma cacao TaxID=3641 RepID=A0A061FAR6_THECC|nr:Uncharacterized protein TCM_033004 [Theobroma cacao]